MKGNNKKIAEKTKQQQQSAELNNEDLFFTEQWEDEQLEIFSDIIIAVLIKESLKNYDDEESDI